MRRGNLSVEKLSAWIQLNNISLNGIQIKTLSDLGSGIVATRELSKDNDVLMIVPQELVLSLENVWVYAKADQHLSQVLEAVGDYSRVQRASALEG